MMIVLLVLVYLTGPDGQQIELNPEHVVALRAPRDSEKKQFAPGVQCLIYTADTHYIGVKQTCTEVRNLIMPVPLPRERPFDLDLKDSK